MIEKTGNNGKVADQVPLPMVNTRPFHHLIPPDGLIHVQYLGGRTSLATSFFRLLASRLKGAAASLSSFGCNVFLLPMSDRSL